MNRAGWLLLFAAVMVAGPLWAQQSVNLASTVADDRIDLFLFDVDFGSTPQSLDVTVQLNTTGSSGLYVEVSDLDEIAGLGPNQTNDNFVIGAGNVTVTLTTSAWAGIRPILVYIETDDIGPPSPYTGTVTISGTGTTVAQTGFVNVPIDFTGFPRRFDRYGEYLRLFSTATTLSGEFTVDYGATAHATTFSIEVGAQSCTEMRVYDITGATPTLMATILPSGGNIVDYRTYTTNSYSGQARFRVEIDTLPQFAGLGWKVTVASDVSLTATVDQSAVPPVAVTSSSSSGNSGCVAGAPVDSTPLVALLVALLAIVVRHFRSWRLRQTL